jgi:hypothetical protein
MSLERIDISERRVRHACHRTTVVQQFTDIGAAAAHALKPCPRHQPVRIGELGEPGLDLRIAPDCTGEPQQIVHPQMPALCNFVSG